MKTNEKDLQKLMGFETQKNVSDRLFQKISELIMTGELQEGYVFPNETVLCEQLNVGRTSLREAYKALELSGYVTRTKRGTTVNSRSSILSATPLRTVFHAADHEDFTRFRLMIEPQCAALAAANAGLNDVEKLDLIICQSQDALDVLDYERLMDLDEQFHTGIAAMSGSKLLSSIIAVMAAEWRTGIRRNFEAAISTRPELFATMILQHRAIADAILSRDLSAGNLMEEHIRTVTL